MSASTTVDLGNTCQILPSITGAGPGSGIVYAASGAIIGQSIDRLNSDTFCNLLVQGQAVFGSGLLRVAVQSANADVSGQYTDPTSGLAALPTAFSSGGILWINSGALGGGVLGALTSGQAVQSGFSAAAGFQAPGRYVRANVLSGDFYAGPLNVSFVSQLHTTGSGGGFSMSPSSGAVSV